MPNLGAYTKLPRRQTYTIFTIIRIRIQNYTAHGKHQNIISERIEQVSTMINNLDVVKCTQISENPDKFIYRYDSINKLCLCIVTILYNPLSAQGPNSMWL